MTLEAVTAAYSEEFTSATTWTVNHGLGTLSPVVDAYDDSNPDNRIFPGAVVVVDANTLRLDWSVSTAGRVYVV